MFCKENCFQQFQYLINFPKNINFYILPPIYFWNIINPKRSFFIKTHLFYYYYFLITFPQSN